MSKPIFTLTFSDVESFKSVRDYVESQQFGETKEMKFPSTPVEWKYGAKDGKNFIEFYKGTSIDFFWSLAIFVTDEKITSLQISTK